MYLYIYKKQFLLKLQNPQGVETVIRPSTDCTLRPEQYEDSEAWKSFITVTLAGAVSSLSSFRTFWIYNRDYETVALESLLSTSTVYADESIFRYTPIQNAASPVVGVRYAQFDPFQLTAPNGVIQNVGGSYSFDTSNGNLGWFETTRPWSCGEYSNSKNTWYRCVQV